jgi:hypothetical protein
MPTIEESIDVNVRVSTERDKLPVELGPHR